MTERTSRTTYGDAPLSSAYHPDPSALPGAADEDDVLIGRTVTIDRPAAELYAFWRELGNLPQIMPELQAVEVVAETAGQCIEWRSTDEDHDLHGRIEFRTAPADRGTEVTLTMTHPDPGFIAMAVHKLTRHDPGIQARRALRRFKQLMETGEIATATPPHAATRG
jgi:uncharacterized membrane protein